MSLPTLAEKKKARAKPPSGSLVPVVHDVKIENFAVTAGKEQQLNQSMLSASRPNDTLVMVPRVGQLTLVGRKLFNVLVYAARIQSTDKFDEVGGISLNNYFSIPLNEIGSLLNVPFSEFGRNVKLTCDEILNCKVDMVSPSELESKIEYHNLNLVSEIKITNEGNGRRLFWSFPPTIFNEVIKPKGYTAINLAIIGQLKSYSAIALYEICSRFKNNPSCLTSLMPPEWWMNAILGSKEADGESKRIWRKYKYRFVKNAVLEINESTDLNIELVEVKEGNAVSLVRFKVTQKEKAAILKLITLEIALEAVEIGVSESVIEQMLKSGKSESLIRYALIKTKSRKGDTRLAPVENLNRYFTAIVNNGGDFSPNIKELEEDLDFPAQSPAKSKVQTVKTVEAPIKTIESDIKERFNSMGDDERTKYLIMASESLDKKRVLTPSMRRNVGQGIFTPSGMFMAEAIEIFAQEKFGSDWKTSFKPPEV